jgi:hypothetical protein
VFCVALRLLTGRVAQAERIVYGITAWILYTPLVNRLASIEKKHQIKEAKNR